MEKLSFYLSLQHGLVGTNALGKVTSFLREESKSFEDLIRLCPEDFRGRFGVTLRGILDKAESLVDIEWEIEESRRREIQIITIDDDEYPILLKRTFNPPLAFYCMGKFPAGEMPHLAMVGSRRPSFYGIETATYFAENLARCGLVIVSGLARGIDACAHEGALKAGGVTIAVLGSGLLNIYPRENHRLAEKIKDTGGCLISELPLQAKPLSFHFPMRNRIISGLSQGVCVMEAVENSGSLITANQALEEGREIYAVPGMIRSLTSRGTNKLIQAGAKCVASPEDILEDYVEHLTQALGTAPNS